VSHRAASPLGLFREYWRTERDAVRFRATGISPVTARRAMRTEIIGLSGATMT